MEGEKGCFPFCMHPMAVCSRVLSSYWKFNIEEDYVLGSAMEEDKYNFVGSAFYFSMCFDEERMSQMLL